jgi:hypothetical protein
MYDDILLDLWLALLVDPIDLDLVSNNSIACWFAITNCVDDAYFYFWFISFLSYVAKFLFVIFIICSINLTVVVAFKTSPVVIGNLLRPIVRPSLHKHPSTNTTRNHGFLHPCPTWPKCHFGQINLDPTILTRSFWLVFFTRFFYWTTVTII